jgi:hypothetical protein
MEVIGDEGVIPHFIFIMHHIYFSLTGYTLELYSVVIYHDIQYFILLFLCLCCLALAAWPLVNDSIAVVDCQTIHSPAICPVTHQRSALALVLKVESFYYVKESL